MEQRQILAYLDHNILDLMVKGGLANVIRFLRENGVTPVYSFESLKEIQRSKGYEERFLDVLGLIGAKYLEPILDEHFKQTGRAYVHEGDPRDFYGRLCENQGEITSSDFGISRLLMKFYGGNEGVSFEESFDDISHNFDAHFCEISKSLEDISMDEGLDLEEMKVALRGISGVVSHGASSMAKDLDGREASPVSDFEKETGIGPILLNNIKPPGVVKKIWDVISESIDVSMLSIDEFFGVSEFGSDAASENKRTVQEKVSAVYNQLNFIGYYRDSGMRKERRFNASFSDMIHVGLASFCEYFICRDASLVMKAAAAYEYVGARTLILHIDIHE